MFISSPGVYQSLQLNHNIDYYDMDSAINSICEESLPLEIDVTHFLQSLCNHAQDYVEQYNLDRMIREDLMKAWPKPYSKLEEEMAEERSVISR